jgi:hypothetical protein
MQRKVNAALATLDEPTNAFLLRELAIRDELQYIERRKVELATMRKMNRGQRNAWLEKQVTQNCRLN